MHKVAYNEIIINNLTTTKDLKEQSYIQKKTSIEYNIIYYYIKALNIDENRDGCNV